MHKQDIKIILGEWVHKHGVTLNDYGTTRTFIVQYRVCRSTMGSYNDDIFLIFFFFNALSAVQYW